MIGNLLKKYGYILFIAVLIYIGYGEIFGWHNTWPFKISRKEANRRYLDEMYERARPIVGDKTVEEMKEMHEFINGWKIKQHGYDPNYDPNEESVRILRRKEFERYIEDKVKELENARIQERERKQERLTEELKRFNDGMGY